MPTETTEAAPSQQAPAKAETSDAKQSGNVKMGQAAKSLLKREAALTTKIQTPAESTTKAATAATETPATTSAADGSDKPATESKQAETKVETAPAAKTEESDDALSKISPEAQAAIDKRIGKALEKARLAEERAEALQRRLDTQALPPPVVQPTPDNPLANVNDVEALKKELKSAKETKLWAQQQLNRKDLAQGVKVGDMTYTEDQFRDALNNIERRIEIEIPERAEFLTKRQQFNNLAAETFDWLRNPDSEEFKLHQKLLSLDADLARKPNATYLAAAAVEGQTQVNLRRALAADRQGTRPVRQGQQAPAAQLASGAAIAATTREVGSGRAQAALQAEMGKLKKSGHVTMKDAASYFRQKETTR